MTTTDPKKTRRGTKKRGRGKTADGGDGAAKDEGTKGTKRKVSTARLSDEEYAKLTKEEGTALNIARKAENRKIGML